MTFTTFSAASIEGFADALDMQEMYEAMNLANAPEFLRNKVLGDITRLDGINRLKDMTDNLNAPVESSLRNMIGVSTDGKEAAFLPFENAQNDGLDVGIPSNQIFGEGWNAVSNRVFHNHPNNIQGLNINKVAYPSQPDMLSTMQESINAKALSNSYPGRIIPGEYSLLGRNKDGTMSGYDFGTNAIGENPFKNIANVLDTNKAAGQNMAIDVKKVLPAVTAGDEEALNAALDQRARIFDGSNKGVYARPFGQGSTDNPGGGNILPWVGRAVGYRAATTAGNAGVKKLVNLTRPKEDVLGVKYTLNPFSARPGADNTGMLAGTDKQLSNRQLKYNPFVTETVVGTRTKPQTSGEAAATGLLGVGLGVAGNQAATHALDELAHLRYN